MKLSCFLKLTHLYISQQQKYVKEVFRNVVMQKIFMNWTLEPISNLNRQRLKNKDFLIIKKKESKQKIKQEQLILL